MERRRLIADRFHRIWLIVEYIARYPGKTRQDLSKRFSLSPRQIQSDMNIIRIEMDLPLIRRNGYRFEAQSSEGAVSLELAEAQLLLLLLRRAEAEKGMPAEQVRRLMNKLPTFLPTHLRPLLHKMVESGPGHTRQRQHLEKLTSAILNGKSIKLHYPRSAGAPLLEPVVKPSMLLPYLDSWYVIGMCKQRKRLMMFELDTATSVKDG